MFSGSSLCSKHWILNCSVQNKRLRWNMACLDHLHGLENICRDLEVLLFNLYISEIRIDIRRPKLIGIAICRMGTGTGPWRYLRARSWTSNVWSYKLNPWSLSIEIFPILFLPVLFRITIDFVIYYFLPCICMKSSYIYYTYIHIIIISFSLYMSDFVWEDCWNKCTLQNIIIHIHEITSFNLIYDKIHDTGKIKYI